MSFVTELVSVGIQSHRAQALSGSLTTGISAAGSSSQANSTALTTVNNVVGTVSANNGVRLPIGTKGDEMYVRNASATACQVYPPSGGALNGGSANAKDTVDLAAGATYRYVCTAVTGLDWYRV